VGWLLLALLPMIVLLGAVVLEATILVQFYRRHAKRCWVPLQRPKTTTANVEEAPYEAQVRGGAHARVGEALTSADGSREQQSSGQRKSARSSLADAASEISARAATIVKVQSFRFRGRYVCPEDDAIEPKRTEAALAQWWPARCCALPATGSPRQGRSSASHSGIFMEGHIMLLSAGNVSRRGTLHATLMLLLQLGIAVIIGGLSRHAKESATVAVVQVTSLATLQLLMAVWSTCGDPSDRLLSTMASISSSLECSASLCLLAAHLSDDTQLAARLASTGIELFKVAIYLPLGLAIYDSVVLAVYHRLRRVVVHARREGWSRRRLAREVLYILGKMPFEFLVALVTAAKRGAGVCSRMACNRYTAPVQVRPAS